MPSYSKPISRQSYNRVGHIPVSSRDQTKERVTSRSKDKESDKEGPSLEEKEEEDKETVEDVKPADPQIATMESADTTAKKEAADTH